MSADEKLSRRLMIAATMLLFRSHRSPGVRGWELKHRLGKNYMRIIELLNSRLNQLGLQVKTVFEEGAEEDLDRAKFYVTLSHPLTMSDLVTAGWRIDEVAALAAALSVISSRGGKAAVREVLEVLETKFPKWKAEAYLERAIRRGYINKTEEDVLTLGWRTKVELGQKALLKAILEAQPQQEHERRGEEPAEENV